MLADAVREEGAGARLADKPLTVVDGAVRTFEDWHASPRCSGLALPPPWAKPGRADAGRPPARCRAGSSGGSAARQSSCRYWQRGAYRHPERTSPMVCAATLAVPGPDSTSAPGIRVRRMVEDVAGRALLDDGAVVHDQDVVGGVPYHPEVVRHQHEREVACFPHAAEEVEYLRLDRHVERGRRLVRDEHLRLARQRPRYADALALTAAQPGGLAVEAFRPEADLGQQRLGGVVGGGPGHAVPEPEHVGHRPPGGHGRVQRAERILEDHLGAAAGADPCAGACPSRSRLPGPRPRAGRIAPTSARASEVLPLPLSPTMPIAVPARTTRSTSRTAGRPCRE